MDGAIKSWDWINQSQEDYFYLITHHEHEGCGPELERASHKVVAVKYDGLTSKLTTEPVSWDETAKNFAVTIGTPGHNSNFKRDNALIDTWIPILKTILKATSPVYAAVDAAGDLAIDVAAGLVPKIAGQGISLDTGSTLNGKMLLNDWSKAGTGDEAIQVTCKTCGLTGEINFSGNAQVQDGKLVALSLGASPKNLGVNFELGIKAQIKAAREVSFEAIPEIPLTPAYIPWVITFGPSLNIKPGMEVKAVLMAEFDTGFKATIPDTAQATLDFVSPDNSQVSGWIPNVTPIFQFEKFEAQADLQLFIMPSLNIGVSVAGRTAKVEGYIGLKPSITGSVVFGTDAAGFCKDKTQGTDGIKLTGHMDFDLMLHAGMDAADTTQ
ncbi:hypothetical protein ABW20_dc0106690 [Dactylellina cionopaga]|nr:hypothetical protein ABW20_dc0106690 [Dactylellina cionopaga]